jgi:uncharacterized protein (TIGR02246 family)
VRSSRFLAVLLPLALPLAAQQKAAPAASAEGTIRALVSQYDSTWRQKDAARMSELLAPTYLFFTATGEVGSRASALADLRSQGFVMGRLQRSEMTVRFTGPGLAVVSSRWQTEGTADGAAFRQDQRCGLVWSKANGPWQLVSEHCINIPVRRTWRERWDSLAADSARAADGDSTAPPPE